MPSRDRTAGIEIETMIMDESGPAAAISAPALWDAISLALTKLLGRM